MYRSNSTSGTILSTAFMLMALSYSSSVFSAGLFDDLLETAIDNISKEVINSIDKKSTNTPKEVKATKTTVNKAPTKSNVSQAKRKRPNEEHHDWVSYKDWSTSIATFKMQGKWTTICSVSTGALGNKGINIEIPWGSIAPTTMPEVVYFETVQANQITIFKHKQEVEWRIYSKRDDYSFQTHAFAGIDSSGNRYADSKILNNLDAKKSLQLLRAFAKGNTLALSDRYSGVELHTASLSGFSAAYLKAADWCAFSADSVLKVAPSSTYVQIVEQ